MNDELINISTKANTQAELQLKHIANKKWKIYRGEIYN